MSDLINSQKANSFFEDVARIIEQAHSFVGRTADLTMCVTYFEIGRMIVEEEQGGKARAEYGSKLMRGLADFLTDKFGRGFSLSTLKNAKQFYNVYAPVIGQIPFIEKSQTMISQSYPFNLSWSHY
ncbi:MAG: DUF1016 N-terminal domain-containing protein [Peptococcaceae bacterium]|nr:DUF1016 N-terminal domain-containing protein [Peptococcaceae bacterium]